MTEETTGPEGTEGNEEIKDPTKVLAELRRAQEDLKVLRAANKELKTKVEAAEKAPSVDEWRKRAIAAETKVALSATGVKDADRLMKYVGTEGLDFDEEGNLTGLDERMATLKTDLPELFDPKRRVGGRADIHASDSVGTTPKTPTQMQVERIFSNTAH